MTCLIRLLSFIMIRLLNHRDRSSEHAHAATKRIVSGLFRSEGNDIAPLLKKSAYSELRSDERRQAPAGPNRGDFPAHRNSGADREIIRIVSRLCSADSHLDHLFAVNDRRRPVCFGGGGILSSSPRQARQWITRHRESVPNVPPAPPDHPGGPEVGEDLTQFSLERTRGPTQSQQGRRRA